MPGRPLRKDRSLRARWGSTRCFSVPATPAGGRWEGWLRHLGEDRYEAFSAGTRPQGLHPLAVRVMAEAGIDIAQHRSKSVDEPLGRDVDLLITVCGGVRESCPVFLGRVGERRHWPIDDPAGAKGTREEQLAVFGGCATKFAPASTLLGEE